MRWMLRIALVAFAAAAGLAGLAASSSPLAASASAPASRKLLAASSDIAIPVLGVLPESLKSTFHEARAGHVHRAMDILAPRGTPVVASVDGTIRKLDTSRAGGISIYQFDGDEALVYYYAHLDRYARGVREGIRVKRGEVIGYVGTTGNAPARTPHLHFAIARLPAGKEWWKGEPIDPYPILTTPASEPPKLASETD